MQQAQQIKIKGDMNQAAEFDFQQHEALLKSDPARYAEAVREVSAFGIYLIDTAGVIRSWNRGAENITGLIRDAVIGRPFATLFDDAAQREGLPQRTLQFARANRHHKDEQPRRRRNGEELIALCTIDAIRKDNGELASFVEVFSDITEVKRREAALYQRATRDALTGVSNRGHFTELGTQELERARRFSEPLTVGLMDLDHFKRVNDTYGHDAGDKALAQFASVCQQHARKIDLLARLGGEEFVLLLPRANKEPAFEIFNRLRLSYMDTRTTSAEGVSFGLTVSIGLASLRPHTLDLPELLRNADAALYKAKREGRNRVECWFD